MKKYFFHASDDPRKGITPIISIIILLLITIALVGSAYSFISLYSGGLTSKAVQVRDLFGNTVVVSNIGTQPISSDEITLTVNGNPGMFTTTEIIQPGKSVPLTIASSGSQSNVEIRIRGPGTAPGAVNFITDLEIAIPVGQDTTAPAVVMLEPPYNPPEDTLLTTCSVSFNCSATDDVGLSSLSVFYYYDTDTAANQSASISVTGTSSGKVTVTTANYPTVNYGPYHWYCTAMDAAGNVDNTYAQPENEGSRFLFTIINGNNPPSMAVPTISDSPSGDGIISKSAGDNMVCNAQGASDLDCTNPATITMHYNWECTSCTGPGTPVIALNLPFNNASTDGSVTDISGVNTNIQLGGTGGAPGSKAIFNTTGKIGGAYNFSNPSTGGSSTTQTIQVADDPSLDFGQTDNFTIEGWLRMDETLNVTTGSRTIVEKYEALTSGSGYSIRIGPGNIPGMRLHDGTRFVSITSTGAIPQGSQYHHFAFVRKVVSSTEKEVFIYIDGVDVTPTGTGNDDTTSATLENPYPLFIGNNYRDIAPSGFTEALAGSVDELIIWRRALSEREIKRHAGHAAEGLTNPDYSTLVNQELMVDETWTCATAPIDPDGNIGGVVASDGVGIQ